MTLVEEERDIIKVIALIKLIDDEVKYSSSINNISLSLNKKPEVIEGMINSMISKNLLKKKDSPVDRGKEVFLGLFKNRVIVR